MGACHISYLCAGVEASSYSCIVLMQGNALKDAGQVEEAISCYQVQSVGIILVVCQ
jgi:hypothetical protein